MSALVQGLTGNAKAVVTGEERIAGKGEAQRKQAHTAIYTSRS